MRHNPFAMTESEKKKREAYKCEHGHNGLPGRKNHPSCYDRAHGLDEKIGFLDIETSNLSADFGIILSYCIKEENGKITSRVLTRQEIQSDTFDKDLLKQFCEDVRKFDRVITYYGSRFDIPFLRTRCILHGLDFPIFKEIRHTDAYMIVKHKLNLHSRRLAVVAPFFSIPAKAHPLNPTVWLKCLSGDEKALDFVLTHNKEDVESLEGVWHKIEDYTQLQKASI